MQCKQCGRQIPGEWEFCMYCGWKTEDAKSRAGLWWLVGGGAVAVVAAAVVVALALTGKLPQASPMAGETDRPSATQRAETKAPELTPAPTPVPTPVPTPMPTAKALDTSAPVQLRWFVYSFSEQQDQNAVVNRINEYLSGKINTTIELNAVYFTDYDTRIDALIAANDPFDLMETASWIADFRKNSAAGSFEPLDSLVRDYGTDIQAALGPNLRAGMYNGKQYGLPVLDYPYHAFGLLLRRDLVDKYKIDVSKYKTLGDLKDVFATIKQQEPGVYPLFVDASSSPYSLLDWDKLSDSYSPGALYSNNGLLNTRVLDDYTAPASVQMYKLMQGFYAQGYVDDGAGKDTNFYTAEKAGNDFAFIRALYPGVEADMLDTTGQAWVQLPLTQPVTSKWDAAGCMLAIPEISKNPERAMLFSNLLYSDAQLLNLIDYGIEGTHYDVTGTNTIRLRSGSAYAPDYAWQFGDAYLTFVTEGQPQDKWARMKSVNETCVKLNDLGFWFDSSTVTGEQSECEKVVSRYIDGLVSGSTSGDVDTTVAQFASDLQASGADRLIAEMQRQYDVWRAQNK